MGSGGVFSKETAVEFPVKCIVIAPWILGGILMLAAWQHDKDVASRQATTVGRIVAHEPGNHNRYGYTFRIDGREYSGWETPLKAEPKIGQSVTIYYDTRSPDENALAEYAESGSVWLARAWIVVFLSALVSFVIYMAERLTSRRNSR
jgi:hypothetical protein